MKKLFFLACATVLLFTSLVVHAQTSEQNPIVIVPGILASFNAGVLLDTTPDSIEVSTSGWSESPTVHQYDALVQALKDQGLVENKDFFIAFYDWRRPNAESAQNYLVPMIDKALAANPGATKVDIIAHSMGGLVARAYVQGSEYRDDVNKLIMLGTPNHGSGDVYTVWEGGVVPDNWNRWQIYILNAYGWFLDKYSPSSTGDLYDAVHSHIPSVGELMPTYDYLMDRDTGDTKLAGDMQEQNALLNELNQPSRLYDFADTGVQIYTIAGTGQNTVGNIPVVSYTGSDGRLWVDGISDPLTPERNESDGDNRVLVSSAFLYDPGPPILIQNKTFLGDVFAWLVPTAHADYVSCDFCIDRRYEINSSHGDLPTNAIVPTFQDLGLLPPSKSYAPVADAQEILSFWFASPVGVKVVDPNGHTITKDANDIPGARYDGTSDPLGPKMVTIENPAAGNYSVELTGLADGSYHFATAHFGDGGDTVDTVARDIKKDEQVDYTIAFDNTSASTTINVVEGASTPKPEGMIQGLINYIGVKADVGDITENTQIQLDGPLNTTLRLLKYSERTARVYMNSFIFLVKVEQFRREVSKELADDLTARAHAIIDILGGDSEQHFPPPVSPFF
jgi:pimeloyl-ACP methyl ester carboxylesterase